MGHEFKIKKKGIWKWNSYWCLPSSILIRMTMYCVMSLNHKALTSQFLVLKITQIYSHYTLNNLWRKTFTHKTIFTLTIQICVHLLKVWILNVKICVHCLKTWKLNETIHFLHCEKKYPQMKQLGTLNTLNV